MLKKQVFRLNVTRERNVKIRAERTTAGSTVKSTSGENGVITIKGQKS